MFSHGPKEGDGPPEMVQGWQDGCQSGTQAYGWDIYKTFYPFKQDARLVSNRLYMTYWRDAYNYCRHYLNEYGRYGVLGLELFAQPTGDGNIRDERTATVGKGDNGIMPGFMGW